MRSSISLLVATAIVAGIAVRARQFAANPTMSLDEIAVARNVVERSMADLMVQPLRYEQSAPKGFLLAEKTAAVVGGPSDWSLRLFPFLCSVASLFLFWWIAARILDPLTAALTLTLFAFAVPLVRLGSQVKPYAVDVFVALLLLYLTIRVWSGGRSGSKAAIAIAGAVALWFSQPAVFVVAAIAILTIVRLTTDDDRERERIRKSLPAVAVWSASAAVAAMVGVMSMTTATRAYMQQYWQSGFLPLSFRDEVRAGWPLTQLVELFGPGHGGEVAALGYPFAGLWVAAAILGLVLLASKSWAGRAIALPAVVTLAAAAAHQYPFSDRLVLFLLPAFLLGIGTLARVVIDRAVPRRMATACLIAAFAPGVYPIAHTWPPYRTEDVKPVLGYVQAHRQPGDGIYVYYGAAAAVRVYGSDYGLHRNDYTVGGCYRGESRRYLHELDAFRGRPRVWVLFAHAIPQYAERTDIVRYLDAIGYRRDQRIEPSHVVGAPLVPTEAFLYDLGDRSRLSAADAATFKLQGRATLDARLGCTAGPQAMWQEAR